MMKREELEKLNNELLIELTLKMAAEIAALKAEIADLKAQLNQNSSNSSKPPSSDGLVKPTAKTPRGKSEKRPGGQQGHKGHGLKIGREPDEVVTVVPVVCPECGESLAGEPTFHADTRYVYDIHIEITLRKYDIQGSVCSQCGAAVMGTPPEECRGTVNYGNTLRALVVVLTQYACVGIDKTRKILRDILDIPISGGTIKRIIRQFAAKTGQTVERIKENLQASPVLNADETGGRIAGRTEWFHVASNARYTLVTAHRKRGREGSDAGGVLPRYEGVLVHDCWKPYFGFDKCEHAVCCAHLLRELNALIENGQQWASGMKMLLLEMKEVVDRYKGDDKTELSRYYRGKFEDRYNDILAAARKEITPSVTRKKSKAENLLVRFEEYRAEIMRFTGDFNVPFDNNQAERDIRNVKVKQKVSGGFRTEDGADDYANTTSVIGTAVKCGQSVFGTVRDLFVGSKLALVHATE